MPYLKLTGKDKIDLDEVEAGKLQQLLLGDEPPKYVQVQGQTIKTSSMIGVFIEQKGSLTPAYMEFQWTDEELTDFEKEIFGENWEQGELIRTRFNEYLVDLKVINKLDDYVITDRKKLIELQVKWDKLQDLRYRRDKEMGFPKSKLIMAEVKERIKEFANRVNVRDDELHEKISEEKEIIEEEYADHLTEEQKQTLRNMPF